MKKGEVLKDYGKRTSNMRWKTLPEQSLQSTLQKIFILQIFRKTMPETVFLEYAKDTLVAELTTDETGSATIKNLPLEITGL